jgi:hypothetical protein
MVGLPSIDSLGHAMPIGNEYQLGSDIYVFSSPGMASAFGACLMKNTLDNCKADFPPVVIRNVSVEQISGEEAEEDQSGKPGFRP